MLGFDFFLNAGLLSRMYLKPSPFLLPPERMFKLIPLGYLSFLLMAVLLYWLSNNSLKNQLEESTMILSE